VFWSIRKIIFIIATVCFVAVVTGLTLELHLFSHKHPDNHSSSRCSICQQLLITPNKFASEPQLSLPDTDLLKDEIEFPIHSYVTTFRHKPFGPRPPPYYTV